jgi:hypothetical protein
MKTVLTFIAVFFLSAAVAEIQAQDLTKMLTDISEGISPDAFTKGFAKDQAGWSDALKTMDPTDMTAVTDQVGSLVKGLKPGAFKKGAHKELLGQLTNLGSMSDVGGLLTSLVNGLDPSMLTGALAGDKSALLKGLAGL